MKKNQSLWFKSSTTACANLGSRQLLIGFIYFCIFVCVYAELTCNSMQEEKSLWMTNSNLILSLEYMNVSGRELRKRANAFFSSFFFVFFLSFLVSCFQSKAVLWGWQQNKLGVRQIFSLFTLLQAGEEKDLMLRYRASIFCIETWEELSLLVVVVCGVCIPNIIDNSHLLLPL